MAFVALAAWPAFVILLSCSGYFHVTHAVCAGEFRWGIPSHDPALESAWIVNTYIPSQNTTYNSNRVIITDSSVQYSFNATQLVPWYEYESGMMAPKTGDLGAAGSGVGIDTAGGVLELTISPLEGDAASVDTTPLTVVKQTDPPPGSLYDRTRYNIEYFRFYNDGSLGLISYINNSSSTAAGNWSLGQPVYGTLYRIRVEFNANSVLLYCDGVLVNTLIVSAAVEKGEWIFYIDTSKRNRGGAYEGPSTWQLGYAAVLCAGSSVTLPPSSTPPSVTTTIPNSVTTAPSTTTAASTSTASTITTTPGSTLQTTPPSTAVTSVTPTTATPSATECTRYIPGLGQGVCSGDSVTVTPTSSLPVSQNTNSSEPIDITNCNCSIVVLNGSLELGPGGVMILPLQSGAAPLQVIGCVTLLGGSIVIRMNDSVVNGTAANLINSTCVIGYPLLVNVSTSVTDLSRTCKSSVKAATNINQPDRGFSVLLSVQRKCSSKSRILLFIIIGASILVIAVVALVVLFAFQRKGLLRALWYARPDLPSDYQPPPFSPTRESAHKSPMSELNVPLLQAGEHPSDRGVGNRNNLYVSTKVVEENRIFN